MIKARGRSMRHDAARTTAAPASFQCKRDRPNRTIPSTPASALLQNMATALSAGNRLLQ